VQNESSSFFFIINFTLVGLVFALLTPTGMNLEEYHRRNPDLILVMLANLHDMWLLVASRLEVCEQELDLGSYKKVANNSLTQQ
jgi:hypothetical protein